MLDELQEVRSSTTELAKKCERLTGRRRWMVSGTPLYASLSDLRGELHLCASRLTLGSLSAISRLTLAFSRAGELNFLRVSPFGAGHEDGFWHHVIAGPWERRDDAALDALQVLLRALMLRRSKSQTTLDGVPILSLPPRTLRREPIKLEGSELASCAPAPKRLLL